jgi:type I restriction enzyme S subunit
VRDWENLILDDLGSWGSGGTPLTSVAQYYDGKIPWLIIEDLNDGIVQKSSKTITELVVCQT